jgi:peptide/nickel transport system permease protein
MRGSIHVFATFAEVTEMTTAQDFSVAERVPARDSRLMTALRFARKNMLGTAGALVVVVMIVMAIFAQFITSYDPTTNDFGVMLEAPSHEHVLGTDQYGRDLFTRIVFGARTALLVGFLSAFIGATLGLVLGVTSAYFGGTFDLLFQRVMDVLMAFPLIILALAVVSIGDALPVSDTFKVIIAITVPFIPRCARVVRSSALAIREIPYIDAARACGFSHARIILRHMVPNVMAPYLIIFTASVGQAILIEASLSYLGLGVQEPTPAWGLMLRGGAQEYAESAPWVALFPGLALMVAVLIVKQFGD